MSAHDGTVLPPAASALIVGLESYKLPGSGVGLPGSVHSAVRFASWLIDEGLCAPERITLMWSCREDPDQACLATSPAGDLAALRRAKVNVVEFTDTSAVFRAWMEGPGAPGPDDQMFYLFWVGHGVTYANPDDDKVCLIGADADVDQLVHVELTQLLQSVGKATPGVHELAFVSACREPVEDGYQARLQYGYRAVAPPSRVELDGFGRPQGPPATRAVMCAATQGESTRMAGFRDQTFADFILEALKDPDTSKDPTDLFGDFLDGLVKRLSAEADKFPELVTFDYLLAGNSRPRRLVRPEESDVTQSEFGALTQIAERIDRAQGKSRLSRERLANLCRVAYCGAVGLERAVASAVAAKGRPEFPQTIEELVLDLYPRRTPSREKAPGLVVACDLVAGLGGRPYRELAAWCTAWGKPEQDLNRNLMKYREKSLRNAKDLRTSRFPGDECLSILVDDEEMADGIERPPRPGLSEEGRHYWLSGSLWAYGVAARLPDGWWVTADEVVQKALDLFHTVNEYQVMPDADDMLMEFVLPRDLLGRRLEYEGESKLGTMFPVSVRDLERLRSPAGAKARNTVRKKLALIEEFRPRNGSSWAQWIKPVGCSGIGDRSKEEFRRLVDETDTYALVMEHGFHARSANGDGPAAFAELGYSVDVGAAVVLSLHAADCGRCTLREAKNPDWTFPPCRMPAGWQDIRASIDNRKIWRNGLRDLPSILRDFRPKAVDGLQVGVLLENRQRMDESYLVLVTGAGAVSPQRITNESGN